MNKDIAIHGIISYYGDTYTIVFKPQKNFTGSTTTYHLTGYGKFPFNEYPNIPVVNYHKNENVFKCLSYDNMPEYGGSLESFLKFVKDNGIDVINY